MVSARKPQWEKGGLRKASKAEKLEGRSKNGEQSNWRITVLRSINGKSYSNMKLRMTGQI